VKFRLASVLTLAAVLAAAFWLRQARLDFASAAAPDHAEYIAGALQPHFEREPPGSVLGQAAGRLDAEAFARLPAAPEFKAQGKRLCHLSGVPVAWVLGRVGELPVSVIVLRRDELGSFPQLRRRLESGHKVVCARTGRFQFAARVVGEHVVCAMAATSRQRLEQLVLTVPPSG
jgi:hypothetical protein